MIANPLLRWPGLGLSRDQRTGDTAIDAYLEEVDRRMVGSGSNRLVAIAELRDHLEERRDSLVGGGHAPDEAARLAVAAMGDPDVHAGPQRAQSWRRFWLALLAAPPFIVAIGLGRDLPAGLTVLQSLQGRWPYDLGLVLLVGWIFGFAYPFRALPTRSASSRSFTVAYSPPMLALGYALLIGLSAFVAVLAARLLGLINHVPWWCADSTSTMAGTMVAMAVAIVAGFRVYPRRIEVDEDGLRVTSLLGSSRSVPWSSITECVSLGARHRWLVPRSYANGTYVVTSRSADRRTRARVWIWPDMENHDLLVERVRSQLTRPVGLG